MASATAQGSPKSAPLCRSVDRVQIEKYAGGSAFCVATSQARHHVIGTFLFKLALVSLDLFGLLLEAT